MNEPKNETQICNDAEQNLTKEEKANIFKSFATFATNLGKSTGDFFSKIKNANSPQTIIGELNENLTQLQAKREPIITRSEELYNKIVAKKKVYTSAPLAKKRMLELELKSLISEYKSLEQQLNIIVEKEHTISVMRGKYFELLANKVGTKRLNEKAIDKLTDDIEDAADEADNIQDALSDLEKAGARKTKDTDSDSFAADLASFEEFDTNQAQQTEIETDITHPKQESKNVNSEETIGDI